MKLLQCPICNEEPKIENSGDHTIISCCSLLTYEFQETPKMAIGIWNDRVVEYRKMIALERISNNPTLWYYIQSQPQVSPSTTPVTPYSPYTYPITVVSPGEENYFTVTYDQYGNPI